MNNYILIKCNDLDNQSIIVKFHQVNIDILDSFADEKYSYFKIKYDDFEKINKYYKYMGFKIVKYYGKIYYKKVLKNNFFVFLSIFFITIILMIASFFIVDIEIDNENKEMSEYIYEQLDENGIRKFTFKKSFVKINEIKEKIKNNSKDKIDWLEIDIKGMKYVIKFEERKLNIKTDKKDYCNIYATKDGIIKRLKVYNGTSVVKINDYVKKDDLLISGDILLNDNIVNNVCADGMVYAEIWYEVNINLPLKYEKDILTGKKRKNIILSTGDKDYVLLNDRLKNYKSSKRLIFTGLGLDIYLRTDYETEKKHYVYSEKTALEKAILLAKEKINLNLDDNEKIITEKVLQKDINNSTMNVDVFIAVEKQIGTQVLIKKE